MRWVVIGTRMRVYFAHAAFADICSGCKDQEEVEQPTRLRLVAQKVSPNSRLGGECRPTPPPPAVRAEAVFQIFCSTEPKTLGI
jgi:hypothetical protein